MVLSIGMIVKNEEKYLDQCLSALKPILEKVDSELIIADTGSTDSTVEIAKRYTDNVYHFEWINDFAAARNSTLEKSKGEWYMFLDADEIIENCNDLIRFFKSGEHKKYNSGTFIVRSYTDMNNGEISKESYSDFRPLRLVKKREDTFFEGAIHEAIAWHYSPIKHLNVVAEHYGYIFYTDGVINEYAKEKINRNLSPLLETAKTLKPLINDNVSAYREISDCYIVLEDYDKSLEYLDKGLREVDPENIGIIPYFSYKANTLMFLERYTEVISLSDKYFSSENLARTTPLATDVLMYFYRAFAYCCDSRFKEAITDFCGFFDSYEKYRNGKLNTNDLLYNTIMISNVRLSRALLNFYICCEKTENYEAADKYRMPYPIEGIFTLQEEIDNFVKLKANIMNKNGYAELPELYPQLNENAQKQLMCNLRWELFTAKADKRRDILINLASAVKNYPSAAGAVKIVKNYFLNGSLDFPKTADHLKKYGSSFNADILCFLLDKKSDITPFVNAADFAANECVHAVCAFQDSFLDLLENYDINVVAKDGLEKTAELYKYAIALAASIKTNITRLMKKYGEIGLKWQNECGTDACPRELEAAVGVSRITYAYEKKDYELCKNEMNGFLEKFREFSPIINFYRETVEKEEREAAPAKSKAVSEFEQMAITVKQNIREMIKAGRIAEAEGLLSEYAALCPDDIEIKTIKEQINSQK